MLYYCVSGGEHASPYVTAVQDPQAPHALPTPTVQPTMMPAGLMTPPIYYAQPGMRLPDNVALAAAAPFGQPRMEMHSPPFAATSAPQSPATPPFAMPHAAGGPALFMSPMLPPTAGQSPVVFGQVMAPAALDGSGAFRLIIPDGVVHHASEAHQPTVRLSGPLPFHPAVLPHPHATPATPSSLGSFPDLVPPAVRSGYLLGARYEGRVKRFNPNRGYGFLCASHQLLPITREEAVKHHEEKGIVRLDGQLYRRVPVTLDDIFVHYCHLQTATTNNNNNNNNNAVSNPTSAVVGDEGERYSGPVLPVGSCVWFTVGTFEGRVLNKYQAIDVRVLPPCGALLVDDLEEGENATPAGSEASSASFATPGLSLGSGQKRSVVEDGEGEASATPTNRPLPTEMNANLYSPWCTAMQPPPKSFWDEVLRSPMDANHSENTANIPGGVAGTGGDFLAVGSACVPEDAPRPTSNGGSAKGSSATSSPLQKPRTIDEQRRLLSMKGFVSDTVVHVRIP